MDAVTSAFLKVPHPFFRVWMNGKDITTELTPFLLLVSYTDCEEGEADTLDIRVEDTDGRFLGPRYPSKGSTLAMEFGYDSGPIRKTNLFEIDEVDLDGPPDVVVIKGISAGVKHAYRTHQGRAYDNTTLAAIAQQVAKRLHLQLIGKIEPIPIRRVTQILENDLTFMTRLAGEYGYAFNVKGTKMIFMKRADLRQAKSNIIIDRKDITTYVIKDKIMGIAKTAQVSYFDQSSKRVRKYKVRDTSRATSEMEVKLNSRAESDIQAKAKASAALDRANEAAKQFEMTIYGNQRVVAGVNFTLTGMGRHNGLYHVVKSRHDFERGGGYRTWIEGMWVPPRTENGA